MKRISSKLSICLILTVLGTAPAMAGTVATFDAGPTGVEWQPVATDAALILTVSGPEGFYLRQVLAPGETAAFSVFDAEGNLRPGGTYVWELRSGFELDESTKEELAPLREAGNVSAVRKALQRPDGSSYATGSFSILDGQIVAGGVEEERAADSGNGNTLTMKVIHNDNAIVRNALCVGFDCPDAPAFGDSSVLMMENNNRIKFGDTSNSPFPNNDWEIEANSNLSGGQNYLGFNDCGTADNDGGCASDLVFAVEAGVRQNALYVESDGDVGVGTANPVVRMHLVDGDTAALRLEQDGSSGFAPQIWDVAGNETSFFVRDASNGSTLPFRIFPGEASNRLVLRNGGVGIGTTSPGTDLHVTGSDGNTQLLVEETNASAAQRTLLKLENNGPPAFTFENTNATGSWSFFHANNDRFVISRDGTGTQEFAVAANGDILVAGAVVHSSSRALKADFVASDPDVVLARLSDVPILEWRYARDDQSVRHLGPVAEDFYAAFGLGRDETTIAINDSVGVALAAIQALNQRVEEKDRRIGEMEERIEKLEILLSQMPRDR